jgi:hypothetical protein
MCATSHPDDFGSTETWSLDVTVRETRLSIYLEPAQGNLLRLAAKQSDRSISWLVRQLVDEWCEQRFDQAAGRADEAA